MDCVEGKKKTKETLLVLSERLTREEIIIKMPDKTAASVVKALNRLERKYGRRFQQVFKSITVDNGSEFSDCAGIETSLFGRGKRKRTTVYYRHPYSAYEKGTNENINKMIRRFLPKGTDFRKVSVEYVERVETWINNDPREILGFETSETLFGKYLAEAARKGFKKIFLHLLLTFANRTDELQAKNRKYVVFPFALCYTLHCSSEEL